MTTRWFAVEVTRPKGGGVLGDVDAAVLDGVEDVGALEAGLEGAGVAEGDGAAEREVGGDGARTFDGVTRGGAEAVGGVGEGGLV